MANKAASPTQASLEGPVAKVLWQLAMPNVVAVAMTTGVTFADAWYAGQLGTTALASLALAFPFLTLMQMMAGGAIGGGTTSAVARAIGAGDQGKAESAAWHAVLIAIAMSLLFMIILGLFSRPIFELLGGEGVVLDAAVGYAWVVFGGAPATFFAWIVAAIHRGTGDTVTPARAITTASAVQIGLSGLFSQGWFGVPSLGLSGIALAWVLCQGTAAVYLALHLVRGKGLLRLRPLPFKQESLSDIMRVAGLGLINSICIAMTVVVVTGLVGQYGTEALAGYGLGARLELMLVPIAFGVGAAMTAAVGMNFGARQYFRAQRIAWAGATATLVLTGIIGICAALFPNLWLGLFTADAKAYAYGVTYLEIAGPFYALFGAGQAFYFASQGTGHMALPVSVTALRFLTVASLGTLTISMGFDITALFLVVSLGLTMMGLGQALCLLSPAWAGRR